MDDFGFLGFALKLCLIVSGVGFLLLGCLYFEAKLDQMHIEEIRYCPSCGADLLK